MSQSTGFDQVPLPKYLSYAGDYKQATPQSNKAYSSHSYRATTPPITHARSNQRSVYDSHGYLRGSRDAPVRLNFKATDNISSVALACILTIVAIFLMYQVYTRVIVPYIEKRRLEQAEASQRAELENVPPPKDALSFY